MSWIFNPYTISIAALLLLGFFLTATYFWFEFSDRIDRRLLSGEVFTPSAGIYSAPKTLRTGENITIAGLVDYLKSAGYIEKNNQADASRSRYAVGADSVEIEPGTTGMIDGRKVFPALAVKFKKDGKEVVSVTDKDAGKEVKDAQLEPKILSSIAAEGDGRRKTVTFNDLPPHLIKAITVTEDRAFFEHHGVNFRGIARALWRRYEGDDNSPISNQGGSSITQQLVKNLLLTNEPTLERKAKEAYMSMILETRLTKEDIFTLYANQIYLGQQSGVSIYGVGEASNVYFGKDVSQLTMPEAAFLAGIIRSPNRYNPYKNVEKVTERRNQVLDSMSEAGVISPEQADESRKVPLEVKQISAGGKDLQGMPYFSQYAIEELPKVVSDPEALQHLRVYTTIDPDLQRIAYETVNKRLEKLDKLFTKKAGSGLNAALVAIRPKTGEIVAMVGGRNYLENQFNRATDAQRQPGSVFKPFVYAAAINSGYDGTSRVFTAATTFKDEKKTFTFNQDSYTPGNFGDFFSNKDLTLRDALVKSKNVITVDLAMQLNVGKVMNLANKAGLPKVEKAYPSMALGTAEATPLQVATAYTIFANLGDKVAPAAIRQVTTGDGRVVNTPAVDKKTVLRPDVAYIMDDILKDVVNRGTAAQLGGWGFRNAEGKTAYAGKTGTSRDGWFAGFTPEIVCVVYVGFDDGSDLGMKGADSAMPIWADFMREAIDMHPEWNGDWQMPADIRRAEIDIRNGALIRELDSVQADLVKQQQEVLKKNANTNTQSFEGEEPTEPKEIYVTDVPGEFRRVEFFVAGTVPNKALIPIDEANYYDVPGYQENSKPSSPTPTPLASTWQDAELPPGEDQRSGTRENPTEAVKRITLMICPVSGKKATTNCPKKEPKTFQQGSEPQDSCDLH
jgi:penicillin-binding protein 1B